MKSELIKSDGLVREIDVEIPAEEIATAFDAKYELYKKKAKIPGFRPGKVTKQVLKQKYYDAIREEILQDMIEKSYPQVIKEYDLKVASMPDFPKLELDEGKPLSYTVKLEVFPEIDKLNYDNLELTKMEIKVSDEEVDSVVEYMQKKAAGFKKVDREAGKTDALLCDMQKLEDPDNVVPETKFDDTSIDMDSEFTMPEFKKDLAGAKAGDKKDIWVHYPPDYANKALADHDIHYRVNVKEVQERVLPIVDDSFAKAQGESETVLEMRLKIREDLNQQKEHEHRKYHKSELIRQLVENNEIPVPEALVEKFTNDSIQQFQTEDSKIDEKTIRDSLRPMAEHNIRWSFISEFISESEKIEVLQSDTENWIKSFAEGYKMDVDKAKQLLASSGKINEVRNGILEEKLLDFLITKANFVDPPKDDDEKEESEKPKATQEEKDSKNE